MVLMQIQARGRLIYTHLSSPFILLYLHGAAPALSGSHPTSVAQARLARIPTPPCHSSLERELLSFTQTQLISGFKAYQYLLPSCYPLLSSWWSCLHVHIACPCLSQSAVSGLCSSEGNQWPPWREVQWACLYYQVVFLSLLSNTMGHYPPPKTFPALLP